MSHSTADGCQKAPTRFLPSGRLTPVLPPMAASTWPSRVVGTWTTATPRWYTAAAKPAVSVTTPPPTATTTSDRLRPQRAHPRQSSSTDSRVLASSPGSRKKLRCSMPGVHGDPDVLLGHDRGPVDPGRQHLEQTVTGAGADQHRDSCGSPRSTVISRIAGAPVGPCRAAMMRSTTSPGPEVIDVDGDVGQVLVERPALAGRDGPPPPPGRHRAGDGPRPAPTRRARVGTSARSHTTSPACTDAPSVVGVEDGPAGHRHHQRPIAVGGRSKGSGLLGPEGGLTRPRRRSPAPSCPCAASTLASLSRNGQPQPGGQQPADVWSCPLPSSR